MQSLTFSYQWLNLLINITSFPQQVYHLIDVLINATRRQFEKMAAAFSEMECLIIRGKPLKWIVSAILTGVTEYCYKKIARKTQGSAKKSCKSKYP